MKAAIRDNDPVVFLENELLYGQSFPVTPQVLDKDFVLPIGKAKVMRPGKDVTVVAFSKMVGYSLKAAEQLAAEGIDVEVSMQAWCSCMGRCMHSGQWGGQTAHVQQSDGVT